MRSLACHRNFKSLLLFRCNWPFTVHTMTLHLLLYLSLFRKKIMHGSVPWRNGLKESWTRLFSFFTKFFAIFDDFSKWSMSKVLPNFEKKIIKNGKKLAKNEEKPCSTCMKPIFQLILCTRKFGFGYYCGTDFYFSTFWPSV